MKSFNDWRKIMYFPETIIYSSEAWLDWPELVNPHQKRSGLKNKLVLSKEKIHNNNNDIQ